MVDIFHKKKRSDIMSRIKGKNTKPEILVRSLLHVMGYRFRLHKKNLPGKPDIVLKKYKSVVFVHGCYWHRHSCNRGQSMPKTNEKFWEKKFQGTIKRDMITKKLLQDAGWKVIVVWQCELTNQEKLCRRLKHELQKI